MSLLAFFPGGVSTAALIVELLVDMEIINIAVVKGNKNVISIVIVGTGFAAFFLVLMAFGGFTTFVLDAGGYLTNAMKSSYTCLIMTFIVYEAHFILLLSQRIADIVGIVQKKSTAGSTNVVQPAAPAPPVQA